MLATENGNDLWFILFLSILLVLSENTPQLAARMNRRVGW